ncbi:hypothetical protein, partial [Caldithrix abyssi]
QPIHGRGMSFKSSTKIFKRFSVRSSRGSILNKSALFTGLSQKSKKMYFYKVFLSLPPFQEKESGRVGRTVRWKFSTMMFNICAF